MVGGLCLPKWFVEFFGPAENSGTLAMCIKWSVERVRDFLTTIVLLVVFRKWSVRVRAWEVCGKFL